MESLNVAPEQTPAQGENDEELAKLGSAAVQAGNTHSDPTQQPEAKTRPEWVPEKFWNTATGEVDTEGMAKSYRELEKLRGQPQKEIEGQTKLESVEDAEALALSKNVDFSALTQEFQTKGDLSQETYEALEKKGISRDVVQQFVQGQQAQAAALRTEALKVVGGEQAFAEMADWAKTNLEADYLEAYNDAVSSGNAAQVKLAMSALHSRYIQANGQPPKTQMGGKQVASSAAEPFQSRTQYVDAVKNPLYERDSAYRNQVLKRLEASDIF